MAVPAINVVPKETPHDSHGKRCIRPILQSRCRRKTASFCPTGDAPAPPVPCISRVPSEIAGLKALYPSLDSLYIDLHNHPELSLHEEKTAAKMAGRLRDLGFEVTERVGGYGVVGVLKNGAGPTLLVRTDMDALPVREQTGLPYASTATAKNDAGETVPLMHACGHDMHMAAWVGAATLLARSRERWHGTLVFVGQPAGGK